MNNGNDDNSGDDDIDISFMPSRRRDWLSERRPGGGARCPEQAAEIRSLLAMIVKIMIKVMMVMTRTVLLAIVMMSSTRFAKPSREPVECGEQGEQAQQAQQQRGLRQKKTQTGNHLSLNPHHRASMFTIIRWVLSLSPTATTPRCSTTSS